MHAAQKLNPILVNKEALRLYRTYLPYLLSVGLCHALFVWFLAIPIINIGLAFTFGILYLAVLWLVDKREHGKQISLLQAVQHIVPRIPIILGVGLVFYLIVIGGLLLLVIPGIIWWSMYGQARMFVLFRKQGIVQALSSSKQVTAHHRIEILFSYLPIAAPSILAIWIIEIFLMHYNDFAYSLFWPIVSTLITPLIVTLTYAIWRHLNTLSTSH